MELKVNVTRPKASTCLTQVRSPTGRSEAWVNRLKRVKIDFGENSPNRGLAREAMASQQFREPGANGLVVIRDQQLAARRDVVAHSVVSPAPPAPRMACNSWASLADVSGLQIMARMPSA